METRRETTWKLFEQVFSTDGMLLMKLEGSEVRRIWWEDVHRKHDSQEGYAAGESKTLSFS